MSTSKPTPMSELLARARASVEARKLKEQIEVSTLFNQHESEKLNEHNNQSQTNSAPYKLIDGSTEFKSMDNKTIHEGERSNNSEEQATSSTSGCTSTQAVEFKSTGHVQFSEDIVLNEEQLAFKELVLSGKDCVLIGAAGTGKTTCLRAVIEALATRTDATLLRGAHRYLVENTPSTVLTSFTRRAVNNLKRAVSGDFKSNCLTLHKLLEYEPVYYEVADPETGDLKNTMRFEPARGLTNPLSATLKTLVIDESSMVSLELMTQIDAATPQKMQHIYLGDINQLPPVFGSAILGYRMQELPVIELKQIYRQAANSPIIKYATAIKDGITFPLAEKLVEETEDGKITFHPWKKRITGEDALVTSALFLKRAIDAGIYDPEEHMVLCPFNKAFGTIELNKHIANHLARKRGETTHEIIAGFLTHYLSVGDRVMYDKEDAVVVAIAKNGAYAGSKVPKTASTSLDYWGCDQGTEEQLLAAKEAASKLQSSSDAILTEEDVEHMLATMGSSGDDSRVSAASHIVTLQMIDTEQEVALETAASINSLLLGYALTVHKSQGAEWEKVFVLLHQSHATMTQRELLYTAITRARSEAYIICESDTFVKGVISQKIKGNTLEEKAEYFKGKYLSN